MRDVGGCGGRVRTYLVRLVIVLGEVLVDLFLFCEYKVPGQVGQWIKGSG
jgi:hypothetical protein